MDEDDFRIKTRQKKRTGKAKFIQKKKGKSEDRFFLSQEEFKAGDGEFIGVIVEVHKGYSFVNRLSENGDVLSADVWLARVARKFLLAEQAERNVVAAGDIVLCSESLQGIEKINTDIPQCLLLHALNRKNKIVRKDPSHPKIVHVLACNMDRFFIVASIVNPEVRWGLIDRFLVVCENEDIEAHIVLTKADLIEAKFDESEQAAFKDRVKYYKDTLGYSVWLIDNSGKKSLKNNASLRTLLKIVHKGATLLAGHSGVGKSTLVNTFDPLLEQQVEGDPEIFYKGRHTTSYASLIPLAKGGYVIDTPGIRSFGLDSYSAANVEVGFKEIYRIGMNCKFKSCLHKEEPGCKVLEAVTDGVIPSWRHQSYLSLINPDEGREGRAGLLSTEGH